MCLSGEALVRGGGGHLLLTLLYAVTVEVQFNMFCEE